MVIDLIKLGISQIEFEEVFKPNEIDLDIEFVELKSDVIFKGKLDNLEARTEIEGEIKADTEISCHRCLIPIPQTLEIAFKSAFITAENYTEEQEVELDIKDLDVSIIDDNKLDLKELAREQILLNLPTRILCREDCLGLCEKCGANLNLKNCNCEKNEVDPRWSALSNLKIK